MRSGIVQWISEKGYGMIQVEEGNRFVFVSASQASELKEGQPVKVEIAEGSAGLIAKNVVPIKAESAA